MSLLKHLVSFGSGELSPWMDGRTDVAKYSGGCRLLENFLVRPLGPVMKRPGMEFLARGPEGATAGRLAEFQLSETEACMLVIGSGEMHLYNADASRVLDRQTAPVVVTGAAVIDPPVGSNISVNGSYVPLAEVNWMNGKPRYTVGGVWPLVLGWQAYFYYDAVAGWRLQVLQNGEPYTSWSSVGPLNEPTPDLVSVWVPDTAGALGLPVVGLGAMTGALSIPVPWADGDLSLLRWKQINSVMYLVHPDFPPRKLTRYSESDWAFEAVDYSARPAFLPENLDKDHTITVAETGLATVATWVKDTVYKTGQRVIWPAGGSAWKCVKNHTSKEGKPPGVATYQQITGTERLTTEITKPLWVPSFADNSAPAGQELLLTASKKTWLPEHDGCLWEIAKRRQAGNFDTEVKLAGAATPQYSNPIVIQGGWTFITEGNWRGTFFLERSEDFGVTWEEVRSWEGDNDRNATAEGVETERVQMRVKWVKQPSLGPTQNGHNGNVIARLSSSDVKIRGTVRILEVTGEKTARVEVITPVEVTTTSYWSESAWNQVQGFPRVVEMHQGRVVMAATGKRPHTLWGSAVDDYENFYVGTVADEAWMHTIAIGERDPILWLISERMLIVGTGSGEWVLFGEDQEKVISPEAANARRQSGFGSHNGGTPAIFTDSVSVFVQRGGTRVREFAYRFDSDRFEAPNLSLLADHLLESPVEDIAVMRMPWQVVWFLSGGKLFGLTFERTQELAAWHRHSTAGTIVSLASIRATGREDQVWLLVDRGDGLLVERFRQGQIDAPEDNGFWMDAAVAIAPPYDVSEAEHLMGKEVDGFCDGVHFGKVTLEGDEWPFVTLLDLSLMIEVDGDTDDYGSRFRRMGSRFGKVWWASLTLDGNYVQWTGEKKWVLFYEGVIIFTSTQDVARPDLVTVWTQVPGTGIFPESPAWSALNMDPRDFSAMKLTGTYSPALPDVVAPFTGFQSEASSFGLFNVPDRFTVSKNGDTWLLRVWVGGVLSGSWISNEDVDSPRKVVTWTAIGQSATGNPQFLPVALRGSLDLILGLGYSAAVMPMTPEFPLQNGSSRGREMKIHRVGVSLMKSRGGKIGTAPDGALDPLEAGTEDVLFTGELEKELEAGFGTGGDLCVVSDEPFPFSPRALILKMNVYGDG